MIKKLNFKNNLKIFGGDNTENLLLLINNDNNNNNNRLNNNTDIQIKTPLLDATFPKFKYVGFRSGYLEWRDLELGLESERVNSSKTSQEFF